MNEKLIDEIKNSSFFPFWREYILTEINKLNSLSGLTAMSNETAGEEAKIREKTILKLQEILRPFTQIPKQTYIKAELEERAKHRAGF